MDDQDLAVATVDGSEIPFPTTVWMYKHMQIMGETTNLNWCRISSTNSMMVIDLKFNGSNGWFFKDMLLEVPDIKAVISILVLGLSFKIQKTKT